jgi:APA family basic amino acid/polyamine antiporter
MVYLGSVFWASALCLTGKYGDLLDFVVIIVLIFYIPNFRDIYSSRNQMLKDRIELLVPFLPALYIIVASAICIALLYTKTSTRAVGVL